MQNLLEENPTAFDVVNALVSSDLNRGVFELMCTTAQRKRWSKLSDLELLGEIICTFPDEKRFSKSFVVAFKKFNATL